MKTIKHTKNLIALISFFLVTCESNDNQFDATGAFEATEVIVSAEASGRIMQLDLEEGDELPAGKVVGYIDSTQLHLSCLLLIQNQKAILSGRPDIRTQIEALQRELENALADQKRIANLVKGEVASPKQLDDANMRVSVIQSKIDATRSTLKTTNQALEEQSKTVGLQLLQVQDQLKKCRIVNPLQGTILTKYSNAFEVTGPGKPLYKIADMRVITLKAYITRDQFVSTKLGQKVKVQADDVQGKQKTYEGIIEWINDKAEFTPKSIQTKDERANLVYAIKVKVVNDGTLKIGMYGEVVF